MNNNLFPYGAQYYRTPNPPQADWERDLREMKAQGMNTVRLWAMWSWIHCAEDNFDFSHLDRLMDLCHNIGLNAMIQVILENAPSWLVNQYPEARYQASDGQEIQPMGRPNTPGGGWPGLCHDNPPARLAAGMFIKALASHFAGHPALLGYDVWNEVWFELDGYIGNQYYCYCSATIERFKEYLKEMYGDLEGLNQAWYRRYSSWDEVQPPRYWGGYPDWIDWIKFRLANQGRLLNWRAGLLREADPNALLVSHGLPTTLGSMCTHLTDDWRNAKEVDIYGLSCFPHWFNYDNIETLRMHDLLRGACDGKTFWTAETQAGPSGEGLVHSKSPDSEDIRLWNWISLASGAKGMLYWQWRPELLGPESPGFGLCNLDGSPSERTEAASWFARFENTQPDMAAARPLRGEIALLALPESQIFNFVAEKNSGKYATAVRGAYRALTYAGYQVDFARIEQIDDYPAAYLPFPLMIEEKTAERLREYVKNGGILISEACPAQFGNAGYVQVRTPGYGLDEVFGVHAKSGPESIVDTAPSFEFNGKTISAAVHHQKFTVGTANVLASFADGSPAVVENTYGAGRTVLIASYPGISFEWGCWDAGMMIGSIMTHLGLAPRASTGDIDVCVRLHSLEDSLIAYVVNLSYEQKSVTVSLADGTQLRNAIDIVTNETVGMEGNSLAITVDGRSARVFKLTGVSGQYAGASASSNTINI